MDLARVVVVGSSGSGKTTFARRLAQALGAPHVELDRLYLLPGWAPRPRDELRPLVAGAVAGERWVVDGNYGSLRDVVWPRATAVVWLHYSFPRVLGRVVRRTLQRVAYRHEPFPGCHESVTRAFLSRDSIIWWTITNHARRRREYRALGATYPVHELRHPRDAEAFLRALLTDRPSAV